MTDINDKDFGQNTITLRDNRVATSIIPRTNAELDRQVIVDTNVLVEGSTYAKFLEISNGPAEFRKAVFADKELHLKRYNSLIGFQFHRLIHIPYSFSFLL